MDWSDTESERSSNRMAVGSSCGALGGARTGDVASEDSAVVFHVGSRPECGQSPNVDFVGPAVHDNVSSHYRRLNYRPPATIRESMSCPACGKVRTRMESKLSAAHKNEARYGSHDVFDGFGCLCSDISRSWTRTAMHSTADACRGLGHCLSDDDAFRMFPCATGHGSGIGDGDVWTPDKDGEVRAAVICNLCNRQNLDIVIDAFESGKSGSSPYCRIALLPYSKEGALRRRFTTGELTGDIIIFIPPGGVFRSTPTAVTVRPGEVACITTGVDNDHVAVVFWSNTSFFQARSVPTDAEDRLQKWLQSFWRQTQRVSFFRETFLRQFPLAFRTLQKESTSEVGIILP